MREVQFVAVSEDGRGLVLSDADGVEYLVTIDDAIRAAVRQDRSRLGHLQVETEAIRPRDIQARIRAGETAEDVAVSAGIPLEKVRRYEGPVLAEREHVAAQAQSATVRDTGSAEGPAPRLGELMESRFEPLGIDLAVLGWDAWRREDGRWLVRLVYPDKTRARAALWLYDPERRVVLPQDDHARGLVDGREPQNPRARVSSTQVPEHTPPPVRRLASVPREPDQDARPEQRGERSEQRGERSEQRAPSAAEGFALAPTAQDVQLPLDGDVEIDLRGARPGAAPEAAAPTPPSSPPLLPPPPADAASANGAIDAVALSSDPPPPAVEPPRKAGRAVRRAAVPSWDDIVFGTRKKE